jgi:hypothetical protein
MEEKMENKRFWLGILVMVLVFGMTVVGCGDGDVKGNDGGTDPALNGTWVYMQYSTVSNKWIMNNGIYEHYGFQFGNDDLVPQIKGTYSTNNGIMTGNDTHIHGKLAMFLVSDYEQINFDQSKWYSLNEFKQTLLSVGMKEEQFYQQFGNYDGSSYSYTYSVNGDTLIFNGLTWTKIN